MIRGIRLFLIVFTALIIYPAFTEAKDIGLVVRLKGDATIQRQASSFKASLKDSIQLNDVALTAERSRLKMLFDDDSMYTLDENSKLIVREYYMSDQKERSKSVFNLLEGGLRSRVGKTELEIHTPTSVVAARGTYFSVWMGLEDGILVTYIAVKEGLVQASNIDPAITGMVTIEPGAMTRVFKNRPPTPPVQQTGSGGIQVETRQEIPAVPPIEGQQPAGTTPVLVRIPIP